MRSKMIYVVAGLAVAVSGLASAPENTNTNTMTITGNVPGIANPWLAGMPEGSSAGDHWDVAPDQSPLEISGISNAGGSFTFSVTGRVANGPFTLQGPDGITSCIVSRIPGAENGIADLTAPIDALVGVFLDDTVSSNATPCAALDFSGEASRDFHSLSPALRQPFFIGDGLTSGGESQQFVAPAGATRLYLGVMDSYGWANNHGSFTVKIGVASSASR